MWLGAAAHLGKCIVSVFQIALINHCLTVDHLVVVVGVRSQREPGCLLPTHTNCRAARHGPFFCTEFTFYFRCITISELSHNSTDLRDLPFYTSHLVIVFDLGL